MEKIHKMFTLKISQLDTICNILPKEGIILLKGDLASGKTTLVKKIAQNLDIKDDVTSPTFSIMQSYEDRFYHYDIYQDKSEGFFKQGLHENLTKRGLHMIEWADNNLELLLKKMGYEYFCVNIFLTDEDDKRHYEIYSDA